MHSPPMLISLTAQDPPHLPTGFPNQTPHCQYFELPRGLRLAHCHYRRHSDLFSSFEPRVWAQTTAKLAVQWTETVINKRRLQRLKRDIARQLEFAKNEAALVNLRKRYELISTVKRSAHRTGPRPRDFGESKREYSTNSGYMEKVRASITSERTDGRRRARQGEATGSRQARQTPEEFVLQRKKAEVDRYMAIFQEWFDKKLAIISYAVEAAEATGGPPEDGGAGSTGSRSSGGSGKGSGRAGGRQKRQLNDDRDDTPGGGDDNGQDKGGNKRARRGDSEAGKWACPYNKHNPSIHNKSICCRSWPDIHRLKEHLYRRHMLPKFRCARCTSSFVDEKALEAHQRADEPCKKSALIPLEGIDRGMEAELKKRKKQGSSVTEEERWKEIYMILFPNADRRAIPSPYASHSQSAMISTEQWKREEARIKKAVPRLVRQRIEHRFDQLGNEMLQSIYDITRAALSEVCNGLVEESLPSTPRTASRSTTPGPSAAAYEMPAMGLADEPYSELDLPEHLLCFDYAPDPSGGFMVGDWFADDKASAADSGYASTSTAAFR